MTGSLAGQVVRELGASLDLRTEQTGYRGHAVSRLAAAAAQLGYELVVTFGGDGTVNEVANGLMATDTGQTLCWPTLGTRANAPRVARPAISLAVVPGGDGNVFARTLGVPRSSQVAAARAHRRRSSVRASGARVIGLQPGLSACRWPVPASLLHLFRWPGDGR